MPSKNARPDLGNAIQTGVFQPRRWQLAAGVVCFLAVLLVQYALTARANSATWDEGDHIFAGYMSWKQGDFGRNPEHPPLVKLLATIPLLRLRARR